MSRIVIIHPDPFQQFLLFSLLQTNHDEVFTYSELSDSFNVLNAQEDTTAVVLDLSLLDDSSWLFYDKAQRRELGRERPIPILGLSSQYGKTEADQICHEFQLDAFVPLPIDPSQLCQSVQNLIDLQAKLFSLCRQ